MYVVMSVIYFDAATVFLVTTFISITSDRRITLCYLHIFIIMKDDRRDPNIIIDDSTHHLMSN